MLGDRRDDVVALFAIHLGDTLDGEVVAFGRARGEDDLFRSRADQAGDALRDSSTASSAAHPNGWLRLAALPNFSMK